MIDLRGLLNHINQLELESLQLLIGYTNECKRIAISDETDDSCGLVSLVSG